VKSDGEIPMTSLVMLIPLWPEEESGLVKNALKITAGLASLLLAPPNVWLPIFPYSNEETYGDGPFILFCL